MRDTAHGLDLAPATSNRPGQAAWDVIVWLSSVDVPDEVVTAHRDGMLVLFVGAGASMPAPANLPNFLDLTRTIAAEAGHEEVLVGRTERPDEALGVVDADYGVDVHARVAAHVAVPASQPNSVHDQLARLATNGGACRIVTTNYDMHLNTSLAARGWSGTTYRAPALPIGDDFDGIVYLHGAVDDRPRRLVATDADFGRAYLSDAWATRFLARMFTRYVVLFVGYSHNDVVMTFLARGLPPGTRRFAMTDAPEGHWRMLGVQPVVYPNNPSASHHSAIPQTLMVWADLADMGLLDHDQRLRTLTADPPPLLPAELSYLRETLADLPRLGLLLKHTTTDDWFTWICDQPLFAQMVTAAQPSIDPRLRELSFWFAEQAVTKDTRTRFAFRAIQAAGDRIGSVLWQSLAVRLHQHPTPAPTHVSAWLALLIRDVPARPSPLLDYALTRSGQEGRWNDFIALLDCLLTPRLQPILYIRPTGRYEVRLLGGGHELADAVNAHAKPQFEVLAADLIAVCDRHLRAAHSMTVADHLDGGTLDMSSFRRTVIEPHAEHLMRSDAFDVLIDLARDTLAWLLAHRPQAGQAWVQRWADSPAPLLRRLSVYGWTTRTDVPADEAVDWIRMSSSVYDHDCRHEVDRLLAAKIGECQPDTIDRLIDHLTHSAADDPDRLHRTARVIAAALHHRPDDPALSAAQELLTEQHPELADLAEMPDPPEWTTTRRTGADHIVPVTQLHDAVLADPVVALRDLADKANAADPVLDDNVVVASVTALAAAHPEDGFVLLACDPDPALTSEVVEGVIRGWSVTEPTDSLSDRIAAALQSVDLAPVGWAAATMLVPVEPAGEARWASLAAGVTIAQQLGEQLAVTDADDGDSTPLRVAAYNAPEGKVARFWTLCVAERWQQTETEWTGIDAEIRDGLDSVLRLPGRRGQVGLARLVEELAFLYAADPTWTQQTLLAAMDWHDPDTATTAWLGYLSGGSISDALLRAGLLDGYVHTCRHLTLDEDTTRMLGRHLSTVALRATLAADDVLDWLRRITSTAPIELRSAMFEAIGFALIDLPSAAVDAAWTGWMNTYWQNRVDTTPTAMTDTENMALATWIPHLGPAVPAAVTLACAWPVTTLGGHSVLYEIDDGLADTYPDAICQLVTHLTLHTERDQFWDIHEVQRIHDRVRPHVDPAALRALREAAVALESSASDW